MDWHYIYLVISFPILLTTLSHDRGNERVGAEQFLVGGCDRARTLTIFRNILVHVPLSHFSIVSSYLSRADGLTYL